MKLFKLRITLMSLILLMSTFGFMSCSPNIEESGTGQVQFGVSNFLSSNSGNARTGDNILSTNSIDLDNTFLSIQIVDSEGNNTDANGDFYDVLFAPIVQINGSYYSPTFDLPAGDYTITSFSIGEFATYETIYAIPLEGSPLADMVDQPLPFDFSVTSDILNTYSLELLSVENTEPSDFGFSKVSFGIFDLDELSIAIYGQDSAGNTTLVDAKLVLTTIPGGEVIYDQNLPAGVHTLLISQEHSGTLQLSNTDENIRIQVLKDGYEDFIDDVVMNDLIQRTELFNYIHDIHLEKVNP